MNVMKQHMFEVICGAVVVVALSALYLPYMWDGKTAEAGLQRYGQGVKKASNIIREHTPVPTTPFDITGPVPQAAVDFKQNVWKSLKSSANKIIDDLSRGNSGNRITRDGVPQLPHLEGKLLAWEPQPGLLPVTIVSGPKGQDPHIFQAKYKAAYEGFLAYLGAGMPPVEAEVEAEFKAKQRPIGAVGMAGAGAAVQVDPVRLRAYLRNAVLAQESKTHIYADLSSFSMEPWANPDENAPDNLAIFHGFIYTWIQADLVNAIAGINQNRIVHNAPIKRIETISIGSGAETTTSIGTAMFASTGNAGGGGPMPAAPAPQPTAGNANPSLLFISMNNAGVVLEPGSTAALQAQADAYKKSMTGRGVSPDYDVTHVRVVLHMQPSAINSFLQELYKQNNAYTLINVSMQAVDPLDSLANGFVYGNTQVMRVEMIFEAVFYRNWLEKIMPQPIKDQVGVKKPRT